MTWVTLRSIAFVNGARNLISTQPEQQRVLLRAQELLRHELAPLRPLDAPIYRRVGVREVPKWGGQLPLPHKVAELLAVVLQFERRRNEKVAPHVDRAGVALRLARQRQLVTPLFCFSVRCAEPNSCARAHGRVQMLEVGLGALVCSVGRAAVLDDALEVDLLEDLEAARRGLRST